MNDSRDKKNDLPGLIDLENNASDNVNDNSEKIYGMTDSFAAQAVITDNEMNVDVIAVNLEGILLILYYTNFIYLI